MKSYRPRQGYRPLGLETFLQSEVGATEKAVQTGIYSSGLDIDSLRGARLSDLMKRLVLVQPRVLQFAGHGYEEAETIAMENKQGQSVPLPLEVLGRILSIGSEVESVTNIFEYAIILS